MVSQVAEQIGGGDIGGGVAVVLSCAEMYSYVSKMDSLFDGESLLDCKKGRL